MISVYKQVLVIDLPVRTDIVPSSLPHKLIESMLAH